MKLWLISQCVNNGYDTYDSAVVVAETEDVAITIHPGGEIYSPESYDWHKSYTWASEPKYVTVQCIGEAAEDITGVVCASFNAG